MMTTKPSVAVETDRLILRRFRESDLQDLCEYLSKPSVVAFEPYKAMNLEEVRKELQSRIASEEMIAVEEKTTGKLIGNVYLGRREFDALEIGYVFNDAYWGKGFARESCQAVIDAAFAHNIHRIYAKCDLKNEPSWRLLERLGFTKEAFFRQNVYFWKDGDGNPIWKDTFVYGLLNNK